MQEIILIVIFLIKDIFLELGECASLLGMLKNQINPYKLGPAAAVDSTCQRNTFIKHFSRRSEPQRLPGTSVQLPCVGEIADGANALIYLAEGDKVNAALSEAAMVPGAGMAVTGVKLQKISMKLQNGYRCHLQWLWKMRITDARIPMTKLRKS